MRRILGFGKAHWSPSRSEFSFLLEGTQAYVSIRPVDSVRGPPAWWPSKIGDVFVEGEVVTAAKLREISPLVADFSWDAGILGIRKIVGCFAVIEPVRIHIIEHVVDPGLSKKGRRLKHAELLMLGEEFRSLLRREWDEQSSAVLPVSL